jgi:tRNA 2-selenouridine synthase
VRLPLVDDFRSIVLENRPLLDVRAPVEFDKGAFPHTTNIPIMTNQERHLIGIRYKNNGNEAAVALGKELIDGEPRAQRIAKESDVIIIGGRTGSGKTLLLEQLSNSIDLEAIANHRVSSFGHFTTPQPSQIDFENTLAYALIQHEAKKDTTLIIEHESRNIGHVNIPKEIFEPLQKNATLIILETPISTRVNITFDEYVTEALIHYHDKFGKEGEKHWFEDVSAGLSRIQKRLGSERYLQIKKTFELSYHDKNLEGHKAWIEILLSHYYDPMYDYQIEKSHIPILFRRSAQEIKTYLQKK